MVRTKNPEAHIDSSTSPSSSNVSESTPTQSPARSPTPESPSPSPTPPPPPKTKGKRSQTKKKHPQVKVVEPPTKKAKGVTIREPEPMTTRSKSKDSGSRGKKVVVERPQDSSSDSEFDEILRRTAEQSRLDALVAKVTAQSSQPTAGPSHHSPTPTQSAGPSSSQPLEPIQTIPPPDFITRPFAPYNQEVYNSDFSRRSFCPIVYIDLHFLSSECGLNLEQALGYYEPWLSSHLPYSPSVVRTFYCNMEPRNLVSRDGETIEEGISTSLRGKSIMITPSILNDILGYKDPPTDSEIDLHPNEVFQTLRPNEPIGPLNFKPVTMPEAHRALFYIYTRSMINKSKNFTHFAQRDYYLMASFLRGHKRNVGLMIFNEMRRFRFSSTKSTTIPYPHLVSLILRHNKIWYLEGKEVVKVPMFGRVHLSHMGISFPISHSRAMPQREGTPSRADEAQSSRRRSPSPAPTFASASFQGIVDHAIGNLKKELFAAYERLMENMESQVSRLVDKANANFDMMFKVQEEQSKKISELESLLRTHIFTSQPQPEPEVPPASPSPVPDSQAHDDVIFTFSDPITSSPVHVTMSQPPESFPQPFSPPFASEPPPIDATAAMISFVPPSDADKTGEKSDE